MIVVCHHGKNKVDKSKPILYTTHSHNIYVWRTRLMMCNVESVNLNAAIKMQVHVLLIKKVNSLCYSSTAVVLNNFILEGLSGRWTFGFCSDYHKIFHKGNQLLPRDQQPSSDI